DLPFHNPQEAGTGVGAAVAQQLGRYGTVRSSTFEVQVTADIGGYKRDFNAVIVRNNPRNVEVLSFSWK
ncbi:MAG TPA: hypothetical protein VK327_02005, partial [Candidatus Paceibacterota bacterium]|nr:hypothetical protein [Candidatus Paceibacterota bacterium]